MRTAEQIYARVRWDPSLDEARFRIGYEARLPAPAEVAFVDFVPGGDVPWHRILYFAADGEVVWDRPQKIDRLDATRAGRVVAPRLLREPIFTARPPHRFDGEGWKPITPQAVSLVPEPSAVRLLTWNVLFDRYDSDEIHTERRRPRLIGILEESDADVIALQEVEPAFAKLLMREEWVRARYVTSDGPRGKTLDPYGVLLLSRLPVMELAWHELDNHKKIVAMVVAAADRPLVIATVHLTSDHAKDGAAKRSAQLAVLRESLAAAGDADVIALGDFNEHGDVPSRALEMRDAWTELHAEPLPTFDPPNNPIARVASLTGAPLRLDRVLLRTGAGVELASIDRIGTAPVTEDGLFASDHYGLIADLRITPAPVATLDAPVTHRTALAWVPPAELWGPIQEIRREHDPRFDRWMPHVNVLYGFVPEARFDEAATLVAEAARAIRPFDVALEGVRELVHRDDSTLWLDPSARGSEPWSELAAAMLARFPRHDERHRAGFLPHLSLGRVEGSTAALRDEWARAIGRVETRVEDLAFLSRRADGPMEVRALVSLGTGEVRWLDPAGDPALAIEPPARAALAKRVMERLACVAPRLEVLGSRRMGCATATSDLDLLWIADGESDPDRFVASLRDALAEEDVRALRLVRGARLPGAKLRVEDLSIDVSYVAIGELPIDDAIGRRMELDEAGAAALSGASDADAIVELVRGREAAFAELARTVKAWAFAKGLDEAPLGGLPGLAWTILAARTVLDGGRSPASFFGAWAAWDPREPITIGAPPPDDGSVLRIATPTPPVRNCASMLDASSVARLQEALYEAWEIAERGETLPHLFAPPPLARRHAAFAIVTVSARDATDLEESAGWLRGRALSLLRALRDAGSYDAVWWPQPILSTETELAWAIGLGARPISAADLRVVCTPWVEEHLSWPGRASGARIEIRWVEGGEIDVR